MSLYIDIRDAVMTAFDAGFTSPELVIWQRNESAEVPQPSDEPNWLQINIIMGEERVVGFGTGRTQNERIQQGIVEIRVFSSFGNGEDRALELLSEAASALRSYRSGPLSFVGQFAGADDGGTDDGNWWMRGVVVAFEYRFLG